MGMLNPYAAYFLLVWLVSGIILVIRERARSVRLQRLGRAANNRLHTVWLPILTVLLLVIALTRPYSGYTDMTVTASGRDILVVLDVSRSMFTRDVPPSRLELAQRKLRDLIRLLSDSGSADRVGIVLFAGEAYSMCPLTQDYAVVESYIEAIGGDLVGSAGSSLQSALEIASSTLKLAKSTEALILLITDGEDRLFDSAANAKSIVESGAYLSILGVGTTSGGKIELPDGSLVRDRSGQVVISQLNKSGLEQLAKQASGKYADVSLSDSDLVSLLADTSRVEHIQHSGTIRDYHELGPWFVLLALIFTLISARTKEFVILGFALMVVTASNLSAQSRSLYQARSAYERGDFAQAQSLFEQAVQENPDDLPALEGLADSAFKLEDFKAAAKIYQKLIAQSKYPSQRFRAHYNLGNTALAASDLPEAIRQYDQSLKIRPGDHSAQANRNLALALLALTPTPTPSPTPSVQPSNAPPDQQASAQPSPSDSQGEQTPSPNPSADSDSSNQEQHDNQATPNPTATQNADSRAAPSAAPSPDPHDGSAATPQTGEASPEPNATALANNEANAWLDSLDDAPLLVGRRRRSAPPDPEQSW